MGVKRWLATKNNTITNAFEANLLTRGTGSNMGLSDSLEVFSIFGQASSTSLEATRFLVQFPVSSSDTGTTILADRTAGKIPQSGSVSFYLRLFNVAHDQTTPREFTLVSEPISQEWQEGYGLDMESYKDQTYNGTGSNWINAQANTPWISPGGDYLASPSYEQTFDVGTGDLEIDITNLVERWITASADPTHIENYGVGIRLTSSQENGNRSYYTKKFSARGSEFFFKRPIIEARWDSTRKDQRGIFYVSSSALSAADNINTIYFYNYFRGQLTNLPNVGTGGIFVSMFSQSSTGAELTTMPNQPVTGGWVSTGVYSASFALSTNEEVVYDRWWSGSAGVPITDPSVVVYYTGSFKPIPFNSSPTFQTSEYISAMTNLKCEYYNEDVYDFRVYTRLKGWNPTIYTVATSGIQKHIIDNIYYRIYRVIDDFEVVPYGTGSTNHTRLSYDVSGSYFKFDMSLLEVGFEYGIKLLFNLGGNFVEDENMYKFKIIE